MDEPLPWNKRAAQQLAGTYGVDEKAVQWVYKFMQELVSIEPLDNSTLLSEEMLNIIDEMRADGTLPHNVGDDEDLIHDIALHVL